MMNTAEFILSGRELTTKSGNTCEVTTLAPGAVRVTWTRKGIKEARMPSATDDADIAELREALEALILLQAHYARVLNMHDGGQRIEFASADQWIARLRTLKEASPNV